MKLWMYLAFGIYLLITYYFIGWLFWTTVLLLSLYVFYRLYRLIEHWTAPPGHRIKHGLLKGHLTQEYGSKEGGKLYKEMVGELRKRGYR